MNNNLLRLELKQALNKLDSNDYDNFECWQLAQAFNRAQTQFVRREAAKGESTKENINNIQKVLKEIPLLGSNGTKFFQSIGLPEDYLAVKRVSAKGRSSNCPKSRELKIYEGEEANVDDYLMDENKAPSFDWAESFKTHINNTIRIYTNGEFDIEDASLIYARKPRPISFADCVNEFDEPTENVECEFQDDIVYTLIDETAAILAGRTDNFNQVQLNLQNAQRNNP